MKVKLLPYPASALSAILLALGIYAATLSGPAHHRAPDYGMLIDAPMTTPSVIAHSFNTGFP